MTEGERRALLLSAGGSALHEEAKRVHEQMKPVLLAFNAYAKKQAEAALLIARAYERSPKGKKEAAKRRLVALLNQFEKVARYLSDHGYSAGALVRDLSEAFTLKPEHLALANSYSPNSPPLEAASKTGSGSS